MKKLESLACLLFAAAFVYLAAATVVFEYRHPWATEAERRVWVWSALKFDAVPYDVMRPRSK